MIFSGHCADTVVMARLSVLPGQAIISGFKGSVDFYVYMGIPVARKWPRSPGRQRAPAVEAQWPSFTYSAKEWVNIDENVQAAYFELAEASGLNARDLQIRGYLSGLYRYELD